MDGILMDQAEGESRERNREGAEAGRQAALQEPAEEQLLADARRERGRQEREERALRARLLDHGVEARKRALGAQAEILDRELECAREREQPKRAEREGRAAEPAGAEAKPRVRRAAEHVRRRDGETDPAELQREQPPERQVRGCDVCAEGAETEQRADAQEQRCEREERASGRCHSPSLRARLLTETPERALSWHPMTTPLAPSLLVALDVLVDPNFRRTVVLMLEHDPEQGALGLVVNRTTELSMAQLCQHLELRWKGGADARVDWGGPVGEEQGWVLLDDRAAEGTDAIALVPGVHWARSQAALRHVAERPGLTARVLLGYAGWAPGQLESEIAEGAWLVVPANERIVFSEALEESWGAAIRSLGIEPAMLVPSQGIN